MTIQDKAKWFIAHPAALGKALGYKDFVPEIHGKWIAKMVMGTDDMTLQGHRGSYKTTCLCVAIALMLIHYRDKNIIFLRKTDTDVVEVIKNVERILNSDIFQQIFAALTGTGLLIRSNSTEITTSAYTAPRGAVQLLGIGIGGSLTGKHADIIITDDIVNLRDRISRAERERTKAVYQELQNIRNPGGRIINTGTPWHVEDAFSLMPTAEKYDVYSTGLLPAEKIEQLRQSMSPSLFAANYELRHIAAENALFADIPQFTADDKMLHNGIAHIDAAYGGEDWTALTCANRIGDTIYMYGRMWHKHIDTVLNAALADADRLLCAPVYCETNGDKGYLGKEIRQRNREARLYREGMNKYLKISTFLRKWWKNIVWLEGTDPNYLAQIQDYTEDAEHDDAADSASVCCRILDKEQIEIFL